MASHPAPLGHWTRARVDKVLDGAYQVGFEHQALIAAKLVNLPLKVGDELEFRWFAGHRQYRAVTPRWIPLKKARPGALVETQQGVKGVKTAKGRLLSLADGKIVELSGPEDVLVKEIQS
jgi:hypothetical protein